jgi:BolA protein
MDRSDRLYHLIEKKLQPEKLDIVDESHLHQGHSGWQEGGQTHYRVVIKASTLNGLSRIAQHRAINDAVKQEFASGLHALAIKISDQ